MKVITWILVIVVLGLGFLQWKSCTNHTADDLATDKKNLTVQRDSINALFDSTIHASAVRYARYQSRHLYDSLKIDSLTQRQKAAELKYQEVKTRLSITVNDLSNIVNSGTDSNLIAQLQSLKTQLNDASVVVDYLQANNGYKDSLMASAIDFRDSVIINQAAVIDSLKSHYTALQGLLEKTNADLDLAIKQLKKGKRMNLLRTIGEAALVIALLIK